MKENIKNQKGFIPLLIIIIASIIAASAGTGVVLQKQGKLAPFIANVAESLKKSDDKIKEEKPKQEEPQSKEDGGKLEQKPEPELKPEINPEPKLEPKLEPKPEPNPEPKPEPEPEPEPVVPSNSILCNGQYWSPCLTGQKFYCPKNGDAKCCSADAIICDDKCWNCPSGQKLICSENENKTGCCSIDLICNGECWQSCPTGQEFRCPPTGSGYCELPQKEQNKQVLEEYLQKLVEAQKQFYLQLIQEIQDQTAKKEALLQQLNNLYSQISQFDQQMDAVEQKISTLPYTVREEVKARVQDFMITQSQFELLVAKEIQERQTVLQQEWTILNSQRQPLADEYNRLRGNPISSYQPPQLPQAPSGSDYIFYYDSAGRVSYILNPDRTKSYVYYYSDGRVSDVLNPDGSKNNFYYQSNGQLDRISGF